MYLCLCKKNIQKICTFKFVQIIIPGGTDAHNGGGGSGELSQRIIYTEKSFEN